jgi:3-oxoadipate enol-lactonase
MWVAAHAPERVDRLVLCCTSAQLGPPEMWAQRAIKVLAEGTASVAGPVVERWFTPGFAARQPELVARLRAGMAALSAAGYAACCGVVERLNLLDDLARIRAPTLALAGADDLAIPPKHAYRIAAGITGCRVEVVADAAHLANIEQPTAVTALIMEHLGGPSAEDER